jgi:cold-inducible RNA-binding protein
MNNKKIYVGNLPNEVTDEQVSEFFSKYGQIEEIKLIKDRDTGEFRGFGFITFIEGDAAVQALASNGENFNGRGLRVNEAKDPRGDRRGSGGGGRGKGGFGNGGGRGPNSRNRSGGGWGRREGGGGNYQNRDRDRE